MLASADSLLVPSLWYENAPLAVIEAAAYGLGVVASRIDGIPELVREGRTGLLFPPGDVDALAGAMAGSATGDVTLPFLAQGSRDQAQLISVARMVDDYAVQYDRLLNEHVRIAA
jgi:glycosyltransferase involved in cell wall biosynthesis